MSLYKYIKKHCLFYVLLAIGVSFQAYILINSTLINVISDDSVVGLMARHIHFNSEFPLFFYGFSFDGGSAIMAYITSFMFWIFGVSVFSLKLSGLLIYGAIFALSYYFMLKFFNKTAANICMILLSVPQVFYTQMIFTVSYHQINMVFNILLVMLFFSIFPNNLSYTKLFIFGALTLTAYYNMSSVIVLVLMFLFYWLAKDKLFFLRKKFFVYLLGIIVAGVPLIIYNFTHHFSNIKHLFANTFLHRFVCDYGILSEPYVYCGYIPQEEGVGLISLIFRELPQFFGHGIGSLFYYGIFCIALISLIVHNRAKIKDMFGLFFRGNKTGVLRNVELFIIFYVMMFLGIFLLRGSGKQRFLVDIIVFTVFIVALYLATLWDRNNLKHRIIVITAILVIIVSNIVGNMAMIEGKIDINDSGEQKISDVIDLLTENDIRYIYAPSIVDWMITYVSEEKIIASCENMCFCASEGNKPGYPKYVKLVSNANMFGYVVKSGSTIESLIISFMDNNEVGYEKKYVSDFTVIYGFPSNLRPQLVLGDKCSSNELAWD